MRILYILRSMASREAARIDLGLARGIYLVIALTILMPVLWAFDTKPQFATFAPGASLAVMLVSSLMLLFVLAGRLGGDAVGDFGSGLLDLIFVTGLKPRQWLVVRVVQIWVGFLSVWVVRFPILACLFVLGGVEFDQIIVTELLMLTGFLFLSGFSMLGSFKAKSRQQVWTRVMLPATVWELLMQTPARVVGLIATYSGWTVPISVTNGLDRMADTALSSQLIATVTSPVALTDCIPTLVLYIALSGLVLWRFAFRLRAASQGLVDVPVVNRTQAEEFQNAPQRASRRCWDDALAWQAYCIHGYGRLLVKVKCVVYALLAAALLISIPFGDDYTTPTFGVSSIICLIVMLISVGKPSDCLSREIRDETMPTLLLTPNNTDDFFKGWQRGAWHLAWPDIAMAGLLALIAFSFSTYVPWIAVSLTLAILFAGPFMMLSPLVPVTTRGIATGLGLTFVFLIIAGVCIGIGAATHPVLVPFALIPLAYLFNSFVRRFVLPYWMEHKISSIV